MDLSLSEEQRLLGDAGLTDVKVTAPDLFHTLLTSLDIDPTQPVAVEGQSIPLADPAGKVIRELLTA